MTIPAAVRAALPFAAPFAVYMALLALEPLIAPVVAPVLDPRLLYVVRWILVGVLLALLWRGWMPALQGGSTGLPGWTWTAGAGVLVFGLWILMDFPPLTLGEADPFDPLRDGRVDPWLVGGRLAGSVIVVPVMEELFWRAFLMRWIDHPRFLGVDPRGTSWKAVLISSALFATEHRLWLAGFLAGLVYGALYRRTGDLRTAVVAHALTNALLGVWVVGTGAWEFW